MKSLWLDGAAAAGSDPLPVGLKIDDLVAGAGLTGLVTALLLARSGRRVAVIEARHVGAGTTGNTTAKLSLLQGTKLSRLLRRQPEQKARAYVDANRAGFDWLLQFCQEHGVRVQRRHAVTYAASSDELEPVRREHEAAHLLGLDVRWTDRLDVPFPNLGATLLANQAQFDPMDVLLALTDQVREHGGLVCEGVRVIGVSRTGRPHVKLSDGSTLASDTVVLATGTPILDRGLYFAKLEPWRSYALAFRHPQIPPGMYLSGGSRPRSVRDAVVGDGSTQLLVGGNGHIVGRAGSERAHIDDLRHWVQDSFPGAVETHAWSAQDYRSYDALPYAGELPLSRGRIRVATGYDKWGMTNAIAAARSISAQILGETRSPGLAGHSPTLSSTANLLGFNAGVVAAEAKSFFVAQSHEAAPAPAEGQGDVGRSGRLAPTAVSTVGGETCAVSATCTHLGGTLQWNDAEQSWDCPLHGSRFGPDGGVLEGPATKPLRRISVHEKE